MQPHVQSKAWAAESWYTRMWLHLLPNAVPLVEGPAVVSSSDGAHGTAGSTAASSGPWQPLKSAARQQRMSSPGSSPHSCHHVSTARSQRTQAHSGGGSTAVNGDTAEQCEHQAQKATRRQHMLLLATCL